VSVFGDIHPAVLVSLRFLLDTVKKCVLRVVVPEQVVFVFQRTLPAWKRGSFELTCRYSRQAHLALSLLNQVETFGHFTCFLEVVSVGEVDLIHVDCNRHHLVFWDALEELEGVQECHSLLELVVVADPGLGYLVIYGLL